jgi:Zn ribbon nucleic-acid-binding protein
MSTPADLDDRAPICPACGVTQFLVADGDEVEFVCVECGFSDERPEPDA